MIKPRICTAPPGYGGDLPRLEIDGVLHSRMYEIGEAVDQAAGGYGVRDFILRMFREKHPKTCTMVQRGWAEQWGWYVPVSLEIDLETFVFDPKNRKEASNRFFACMNAAKKRAAEAAAVQPELPVMSPDLLDVEKMLNAIREHTPPVLAPAPKVVRIVPTNVNWIDGFNRVFRGYEVRTPFGNMVSLRGSDNFVRVRDLIVVTGREPSSTHDVATRLKGKIIVSKPESVCVKRSTFVHQSAVGDVLKIIEKGARKNVDRIREVREILGVAA